MTEADELRSRLQDIRETAEEWRLYALERSTTGTSNAWTVMAHAMCCVLILTDEEETND